MLLDSYIAEQTEINTDVYSGVRERVNTAS